MRQKIRRLIDEGWRQAERGELIDGDAVFDRIERELMLSEDSAWR